MTQLRLIWYWITEARTARRRERLARMADRGEQKIQRTIWMAVLTILLALGTYACGPEMLCRADRGAPAQNAFGAEWCERDGLPGPTFGDTTLAW